MFHISVFSFNGTCTKLKKLKVSVCTYTTVFFGLHLYQIKGVVFFCRFFSTIDTYYFTNVPVFTVGAPAVVRVTGHCIHTCSLRLSLALKLAPSVILQPRS